MKAKLIIITVLALGSFTVRAQEFIAPYNMMRSNVDVIDTVPADEVWKVESMLFSDIEHYEDAMFYHNTRGVFLYYEGDNQTPKFPFWLNSGEVINLPFRCPSSQVNKLEAISILRFKKPD